MKRYVVGLTFRYTESNHDTYEVITEKELEEFKKFYKEDCKSIEDLQFGEDGECEGDPSITISDICLSLDAAIEITNDVREAMNKLARILPSRTTALHDIKREILHKKYLEE